MNPAVYIAISVTVAACIGGMTNFLAIKMLFRPLNEVKIGSMRLPFTPGLIPKRRADIARSLGEVVASYLVTAESLTELLHRPSFKAQWVEKLSSWFIQWTNKDDTLLELVSHNFASDWESFSELVVGDVVPGWNEERKNQWASTAADYVIAELIKELNSPNGIAMLRHWLDQLPEQLGAFIGSLARMFMDKDQMALKVKGIIVQRVHSPQTKQILVSFFIRKMGDWEGMRIRDLFEKTAGSMKLSDLISPSWQAKILAIIPQLIDRLMDSLSVNMKQVMAAIDLPKLVEAQVSQFPTERLEQVVLGITGRELRAITWLGALIGGLIGLFQAVLVRWFL